MAFIERDECTPENGKTCASEIIPQNTVVFAAHGRCKKIVRGDPQIMELVTNKLSQVHTKPCRFLCKGIQTFGGCSLLISKKPYMQYGQHKTCDAGTTNMERIIENRETARDAGKRKTL